MNLATNSEQGKKILQGIPVIHKANGRRHIDNLPCPIATKMSGRSKASLITCHQPIPRDGCPKYKSNFLVVLQALVYIIGMLEKKLPSSLSRALAPTGNLLS